MGNQANAYVEGYSAVVYRQSCECPYHESTLEYNAFHQGINRRHVLGHPKDVLLAIREAREDFIALHGDV